MPWRRTNLIESREQMLESQIIATLNLHPKKRKPEHIELLEENCIEKQFFRKFLEEQGIETLRQLLSYCYHE